ncbi:MAG: ABC transporter permease [Verrucomicrobia bacterium]|nr:ABC transporter permease [Verrucomicrobiota bacterium]
MNLLQKFQSRLGALFRKRELDTDMDDEMRSHIEMRTQQNIEAGMNPEEACFAALRQFGWTESIKETCREQRGVSWLENFAQDIRYGARQLRKNPGFTAVAVLTLALGIGANTAIFSVVNAVLLKALSYREPDRIVMLWTDNPSLNLGLHEMPAAPPDLLDWRSRAQSFEQIAAFRTRTADLSEQGDPERVGGVQATANLFLLLGVQPMLGRVFSADEEQPGKDKVVVISHGLWQRRFASDTNIIGQAVTVNRERYTVIGVMHPGFNFPRGAEMPAGYALMAQTDVWRPYAEKAEYWRDDDTRDFIAMGRLKPGVALAQAQAEMAGIAQREAETYPKSHAGWTIHLRPLALQVAGKTRPVLFVLLGAVAFVLLIACANVANLLLCRSAARRKEMAVRAAIGAGRSRIVRQLLTESVLLSTLGGGIGLLLGALGVQAILRLSPPNIPRLSETTLDGPVFLFSLFVSLATGIIFGLAPSWSASKVNLSEALNADSRSGTAAGRHRTHGLLVIAEVALAVILLTGAGLMFQSLLRLQAVDPGFKPQRVAAFDVGLNGVTYEDATRQRQFYREACKRLVKVPGIHAAAAISNLPLGGVESLNPLFIEGTPPASAGKTPFAENRKVTPGYFETMGVSPLRGRDFADRDTTNQPNVCIINETIARTFFSGADPIGKRLKMARMDEEQHLWFTIIGVAGDVRSYGLEVKPRPQVYTTVEQDTDNEMTFIVRAGTMPVVSLERAIRTEMKSLDPALPLANFRTMESLMVNAVARPRFSTILLGLFAAMAFALTVVGLYGVVAYAVNQRTREVGIRMALGASGRNVLALVIRQGMLPALIGLAIGLASALALTRVLASQLYEVKATDPLTFLGVVAVLLLVALTACLVPARRAARVDPMAALRSE